MKKAIHRFIRIIVAYFVTLLLKFVLENAADFNIPTIVLPVISAVLNAVAKYIREKWDIDVKIF